MMPGRDQSAADAEPDPPSRSSGPNAGILAQHPARSLSSLMNRLPSSHAVITTDSGIPKPSEGQSATTAKLKRRPRKREAATKTEGAAAPSAGQPAVPVADNISPAKTPKPRRPRKKPESKPPEDPSGAPVSAAAVQIPASGSADQPPQPPLPGSQITPPLAATVRSPSASTPKKRRPKAAKPAAGEAPVQAPPVESTRLPPEATHTTTAQMAPAGQVSKPRKPRKPRQKAEAKPANTSPVSQPPTQPPPLPLASSSTKQTAAEPTSSPTTPKARKRKAAKDATEPSASATKPKRRRVQRPATLASHQHAAPDGPRATAPPQVEASCTVSAMESHAGAHASMPPRAEEHADLGHAASCVEPRAPASGAEITAASLAEAEPIVPQPAATHALPSLPPHTQNDGAVHDASLSAVHQPSSADGPAPGQAADAQRQQSSQHDRSDSTHVQSSQEPSQPANPAAAQPVRKTGSGSKKTTHRGAADVTRVADLHCARHAKHREGSRTATPESAIWLDIPLANRNGRPVSFVKECRRAYPTMDRHPMLPVSLDDVLLPDSTHGADGGGRRRPRSIPPELDMRFASYSGYDLSDPFIDDSEPFDTAYTARHKRFRVRRCRLGKLQSEDETSDTDQTSAASSSESDSAPIEASPTQSHGHGQKSGSREAVCWRARGTRCPLRAGR